MCDAQGTYNGSPSNTDRVACEVYWNTSSGALSAPDRTTGISSTSNLNAAVHAHGVAVGDLNNDGWMDVVVESGCHTAIHGSNSMYCASSFTPSSTKIFTSDTSGGFNEMAQPCGTGSGGCGTANKHTYAVALVDVDNGA